METKKEFVEKYVKPMFVNMGTGITNVEYLNIEEGPHRGEELIIVTFGDDISLKVNVYGDSKAAMVDDMYRQRAVYSTSYCERWYGLNDENKPSYL